jgi:hypothetical protein
VRKNRRKASSYGTSQWWMTDSLGGVRARASNETAVPVNLGLLDITEIGQLHLILLEQKLGCAGCGRCGSSRNSRAAWLARAASQCVRLGASRGARI